MEIGHYSTLQNYKNNISIVQINAKPLPLVSSVFKNDLFENKNDIVSKSLSAQVQAVSNNSSGDFGGINNKNTTNKSNSAAKMGSRRIFTPQFKLQVLESYRSDNDCKGNQRATARKYNIHRRQIQKWLQCEANLRSSVANINQNSVKHQFHHISHQTQQQIQSQMQVSFAASKNNRLTTNPPQQQISLDTEIQSVNLYPLKVPSVETPNAPVAGIMPASNFATNISSSTVSPLRPTAIGGGKSITISTSMLHPQQHHHHHHHHQYSMPYTYTPVNLPVLPPLPPHQIHHHYNSATNTPSLTQTHHQPAAFLPSACLPVTVLSAPPFVPCSSVTEPIISVLALGRAEAQNQFSRISDELCESRATAATATLAGNSYVLYEDNRYKCSENRESNYTSTKNVEECLYMQLPSSSLVASPIDLSFGARTDSRGYRNSDFGVSFTTKINLTNHKEKYDALNVNDNSVIDLTFRKRKVTAESAIAEQPEKLSKFSVAYNKIDLNSGSQIELENNDFMKEKCDKLVKEVNKSPISKPVKLFKPYLMDFDDTENSAKIKSDLTAINAAGNCNREPKINNHMYCLSPHSNDSRDSNFPTSINEKPSFQHRSSSFPGSKQPSPQSAVSSTSIPTLSPTNSYWPKGSPVSGYESSSSTYSESSCRSECYNAAERNKTLNVNFEVHNVCNFNQKNIEKWLDQDTTKISSAAASSIAMYA